MSMVSKTLCNHFFGQGNYYGYTHAWTKLHSEVMSWMSVIMHGSYLRQTWLPCVIWWYHLWAAWPCLSWSAVAFSRYIGVELLEIHRINFRFSVSVNLKCTYAFIQVKFSVYGHMQTYTRVLQCSPASVGLAQARPNEHNIWVISEYFNKSKLLLKAVACSLGNYYPICILK